MRFISSRSGEKIVEKQEIRDAIDRIKSFTGCDDATALYSIMQLAATDKEFSRVGAWLENLNRRIARLEQWAELPPIEDDDE